MFRLRANTTKRVDTKLGPDGTRRHGRRVPLHDDAARISWLARHAERSGFRFAADSLRLTAVAPIGGRGGKSVTVAGTLFDGSLQVVDADRFRVAIQDGIGPAKAYGFGLLSIAPIR